MNNDKMIISLYEIILKLCLEHFEKHNKNWLAEEIKAVLRTGNSLKEKGKKRK